MEYGNTSAVAVDINKYIYPIPDASVNTVLNLLMYAVLRLVSVLSRTMQTYLFSHHHTDINLKFFFIYLKCQTIIIRLISIGNVVFLLKLSEPKSNLACVYSKVLYYLHIVRHISIKIILQTTFACKFPIKLQLSIR